MTIRLPDELARREADTKRRLRQLAGSLNAFDLTDERHPWVTIYATGSVGRFEAGPYSDLDVFIVDASRGDTYGEPTLGNLDRHELVADIIRAARGAEFPPFSRDGEFLQVHRLDDLIKQLGKPDDDHLNVFTARMLLLLESHCLVCRAAYDRCVQTVIDRYWAEDSEEHDFRPTILINDIVRYWKTLCLSYEGWRNKLGRPLNAEERIDLLKLKFNRLWLCFVGLNYLLLGDETLTFSREHVAEMVELSPAQRMLEISRRAGEPSVDSAHRVAELVTDILDQYNWWLTRTATTKEEILTWVGDDAAYRDASARARAFGDGMWRLAILLGDRVDLTRYLLV